MGVLRVGVAGMANDKEGGKHGAALQRPKHYPWVTGAQPQRCYPSSPATAPETPASPLPMSKPTNSSPQTPPPPAKPPSPRLLSLSPVPGDIRGRGRIKPEVLADGGPVRKGVHGVRGYHLQEQRRRGAGRVARYTAGGGGGVTRLKHWDQDTGRRRERRRACKDGWRSSTGECSWREFMRNGVR